MIYDKNDLFYEPPKVYPEQDFEVDGIQVHFSHVAKRYPHFDFHGDISETGYRSDFVYQEGLDELGVEGLARERIAALKAKFHKKQSKLNRKHSKEK